MTTIAQAVTAALSGRPLEHECWSFGCYCGHAEKLTCSCPGPKPFRMVHCELCPDREKVRRFPQRSAE